jgi:hypothetical protein
LLFLLIWLYFFNNCVYFLAKASSISTFVNWGSNTIISISFPFIEVIYFTIIIFVSKKNFHILNKYKNFIDKEAINSYSFVIFGVLLIIFTLFVLFFVPETKNKSIEEIRYLIENQTFYFDFGGSLSKDDNKVHPETVNPQSVENEPIYTDNYHQF